MKPKHIALTGGVVVILGSFLPWVTLSSLFESVNITGVEHGLDGPLTIAVGLVAVVAAAIAKEIPGHNGSIPAAICGMLGVGIVLANYLGILNLLTIFRAQGIQVSVGIGLFLIPIGAIVATVGGYKHNVGELVEPLTPPAPLTSWIDVWKSALTRPVVATFEAIARNPNATSNRAYRWIFVAYVIGAVVQVVAVQLLVRTVPTGGLPSGAILGATSVCVAIFIPFLAVLGFAIGAAITNWLARRLGGTGTYSQLIYAYAAYGAPLALITFVLGAVPISFLNSLNLGLGIYGAVLQVVALKAVHQIGWGRAIASAFGILLLFVGVACGVVVILAILGPSIGNIFSNIVSNI